MLKLVLQTQEGQQIEVTVSPDDTFGDLQRQYENPENPGLPELLKHLITNGIDVDDETKVFDYVTNGSSTDWLVEESIEDITGLESTVDNLQNMIKNTSVKECCVENCRNTEITVPDKVFFPLPKDKDRLSSWLIGIGKPELFDISINQDLGIEEKHFVCADHFERHQFLKGTNQALKRRACPSLFPSHKEEGDKSSLANERNSIFVKTELIEDTSLIHVTEETNHPDVPDTVLELFDNVLKDKIHPGVLCRLCGEPAINSVYLFTAEDCSGDFSVADKINLCLPITVNAKDPLPKQVCKDCFEKLEMCHKLAKTCLETEDKLKTMFEMKRFQVEDKEDKDCPLCVSGNMRIVTKSGIYRKDKAQSIPECLKNSSARTRQVSPSKNSHNKIGTWCSSLDKEPLQELDNNAISPKIVKKAFAEEEIPMDSSSYLLEDELSCSVCFRKENNMEILIKHAKEHDGFPCTICKDVNFDTINEQQLHFLKHGANTGYCEICSIEWTDIEDPEEHIKLCKPEFWNVECAQCGEKFPHVEAGNDHVCRVSESEEEWFECDQCGKKFAKKGNLNAHMKAHESRETVFYKCSFCNKQFTRKGSLHKHISLLHGDAESSVSPKCYKCKKCDEAFATAASTEAHITEKHFSQLLMADMNFISDQFTAEEMNLSRVYICEYCERCFTIPSSLHDHRQNEHCDILDYQCNICNNKFDSYKSLLRHKTLHVKENDFEDLGVKQYYLCNYCNKTFLHYGTLTVHTSQHQPPLPYLCRLCNFQFATYKEVAEHRKLTHPYYQSVIHERPNNLYNCQYCEKSFTHEVSLIKHIRMHTGERPYKCSVCGKGFSQTSGLYTHLKVHSDLRPYGCPQCPQTFKIKGDRDNHVKKHSGDRPYKCDFCEKAFMTQHVYSQHRKIHTNERPYKCDVCGEAFRRSHVLTVHMRRHTGEKPHVCDMCPKAYRQRGDLLKHKKIQHGVGANSLNLNGIVSNLNTSSIVANCGDISSAESATVFLPI